MKKEITGVMIYYYKVCKRKLWYFYNEIQMEQGNENVLIGKAIDEETYKRDKKHINIDNIINIDFIRSKGILHEVKKSKKIEEASILQVKYYLYFLKKRGVNNIKGKIDYPLLKQSIDVELLDDDIKDIEKILDDIKIIVKANNP
ncbi:CRISPR-associated protein Cas4, partial [uncultured Clostridium sp.]